MKTHTGALEIKSLTISLQSQALFKNFSLIIDSGEWVSLTGASGSGKSTLLAWLCGVLDPSFDASGELFLGQKRIDNQPCEKRSVGLLFQDALLFPHLSVGENLMFGIPAGINKKERQQKAQHALEEAGLADMFKHSAHNLSGGQRARVSLMRTLLSEPQVLLLDEPFSKLDQALRTQFREFVLRHTIERQLPVLMVTHDPDDIPPNSRKLSMSTINNSATASI